MKEEAGVPITERGGEKSGARPLGEKMGQGAWSQLIKRLDTGEAVSGVTKG